MKKLFTTLALLLAVVAASAQIIEPVKWKFSTQTIDSETIELHFDANIDFGWHLYGLKMPDGGPQATRFIFEKKSGATLEGGVTSKSRLVEAYDQMFEMTLNWYAKRANFVQKVKVKPGYAYHIKGYVKYQCCNDEACISDEAQFDFVGEGKVVVEDIVKPAQITNLAAPDTTESILAATVDSLGAANIASVAQTADNDLYLPVIDQLRAFEAQGSIETRPLWIIFLLGMLGGFLALLTPCVWPIIPMTVSFFLKRGSDKRQGRRDAILYGLSIIVIYLALGLIITAIFGPSALNSLSTSAIFNLFFFALLVVFAVSFFGAFELTLPEKWTSSVNAKSESTSGIISILLMAFTLALVSFSCTGPIIGLLLVEVSTSGSFLAPLIGMAGFAIALALPFSFFAFFPTMLKSLPKSGGWLNVVKVVLGFIELALALKFFSVADLAYGWGLLDRETFLALWIVIFVLLGFYLLGKIRFPHDDKVEHVSVGRFSLALVSLAFAVYMVPGLWGAPLRAVSAFAPPLSTQDFNLYENAVHPQYDNYEAGMAAARLQGKPLMIDFSGFGCVNCRKMEAAVWIDPKVAGMLQNDFVLITLMVDDKTTLAQPIEVSENGKTRTLRTVGDRNSYLQRHKFGANAQPFYVILDANANPVTGSYAYDEDIDKFVDFLQTGIKNYKTAK